jgi:hypothetical protein
MDRWIQSVASLCDTTVSSVASCCSASKDPSYDAAKMVVASPPVPSPSRPRRGFRFNDSSSLDARSSVTSGGYISPATSTELSPSVVKIYTFHADPAAASRSPASFEYGGHSSSAAIDVGPAAAIAVGPAAAGRPPLPPLSADGDSLRARCFPWARRGSPAGGETPHPASSRADPAGGPPSSARSGGSGKSGGSGGALHRAARRGNPEMLRFILGCVGPQMRQGVA